MEFRIGFSTYLTFVFSFSNFILLLYTFVPWVHKTVSLAPFSVLLVMATIPVAIYAGHMHNKKQFPEESRVSAHLSHYKDKIQPESKESLSNKFNVRNLDYTIWSLDLHIWNTGMTKKNMQLWNFLLEKFDAPHELNFDMEIKEIEEWQKQSKEWKENLKKWREIFQAMQEGKSAMEFMNSE